jgi:hypothetical protein
MTMKTTILTTILSAAALSAALFASPASAQSCTCRLQNRVVQVRPREVTVAPPLIVNAPYVDEYYGDDESYYTYDTPEVIVAYPFGYWGGGWYGGRYFNRGYYGNRGVDSGYRGGQHFYGNGGHQGVVRGGGASGGGFRHR